MTLNEYIASVYGKHRGATAAFLKDNPHILAQELSRWKKKDYLVHMNTGEIYNPTSKKVNLKNKIKT
jgi:hypothetical protein